MAAGHYIILLNQIQVKHKLKTDSGLTYVPQTDTINVTKVIGQLEGSASYAETASCIIRCCNFSFMLKQHH